MAWWRVGGPRDDDEPRTFGDELAHSPWDRPDEAGSPLPGPDVLSSEPSRRRSPPRAKRPEPAEPLNRPSPKEWLDDHRMLLIALAGVIVGALLASVAVHSYDEKQAEAARRNTVNLTARVPDDAIDQTNAQRPWVLRLIVTNSGQTNIDVKGARLGDDRFESSLHPISVDTKIRAGQESWISLNVTHSCDHGAPAPSPQTVVLSVVPDGRVQRDVPIRLADDGARISDAAYQNCLSPLSDVWTSAELTGTPKVVGGVLNVPVQIHFVDTGAASIQDLRTVTLGLTMTASPLPARVVDDISAQIVLRWKVSDCAHARTLAYAAFGMTTTVGLRGIGKPLLTDAVLDADAILAIVRFVTATCR
jgi:hypothetical protein